VLVILYRLIDTPAPSDLPDEVDVSRENMEAPEALPAAVTSPPPPAV
jgi:hypothetical protein